MNKRKIIFLLFAIVCMICLFILSVYNKQDSSERSNLIHFQTKTIAKKDSQANEHAIQKTEPEKSGSSVSPPQISDDELLLDNLEHLTHDQKAITNLHSVDFNIQMVAKYLYEMTPEQAAHCRTTFD